MKVFMEFTKSIRGPSSSPQRHNFFLTLFVDVWQEQIVVKSREIKRNNNIRYPSVQLYI